jgi:hypothetical protein
MVQNKLKAQSFGLKKVFWPAPPKDFTLGSAWSWRKLRSRLTQNQLRPRPVS